MRLQLLPKPVELLFVKGMFTLGATAGRLYDQLLGLKAVEAELELLRGEWELLWLARARRSEVQVALGYFAGLRTRLGAAVAWLGAQREAPLAGGPLDGELGTHDDGHHRILWQEWPD